MTDATQLLAPKTDAIVDPILAYIIFAGLGLSLVVMLYRLFRGPHVLDRIMCLDMVAVAISCLMASWALISHSEYFFDALLVLTITGFVTQVSLAKFLEQGELFE